MAIIQMGGIVSKISGKIGGQTFANNRAGSFLKNTGTYKKALTHHRSQALAKMTANNQKWRALNELQRGSFNAGAINFPYLNRLGETKYYSGYQLFNMFSGNLGLMGGSITFCPSPYTLAGTFDWDMGSNLLGMHLWNFGSPDPNLFYALYMSPPVSQGRTLPSMSFRSIVVRAYAWFNVDQNVATFYRNRYGEYPSGAKIYWYIDGIHATRGIRFKKLSSGVFTTI